MDEGKYAQEYLRMAQPKSDLNSIENLFARFSTSLLGVNAKKIQYGVD